MDGGDEEETRRGRGRRQKPFTCFALTTAKPAPERERQRELLFEEIVICGEEMRVLPLVFNKNDRFSDFDTQHNHNKHVLRCYMYFLTFKSSFKSGNRQ